jgi:hypothetical protein
MLYQWEIIYIHYICIDLIVNEQPDVFSSVCNYSLNNDCYGFSSYLPPLLIQVCICSSPFFCTFWKCYFGTGCWWLMPVILATWEAVIGENQASRPVRANSTGDPVSTITRAKWTRGAAQVVLYLLHKCKALNTNPRATKKKKKKSCVGHFTLIRNLQSNSWSSCLSLPSTGIRVYHHTKLTSVIFKSLT